MIVSTNHGFVAEEFRPSLHTYDLVLRQPLSQLMVEGVAYPAPTNDRSRKAAVWLGGRNINGEIPILATVVPHDQQPFSFSPCWFVGVGEGIPVLEIGTAPPRSELAVAAAAIEFANSGPYSLGDAASLLTQLMK